MNPNALIEYKLGKNLYVSKVTLENGASVYETSVKNSLVKDNPHVDEGLKNAIAAIESDKNINETQTVSTVEFCLKYKALEAASFDAFITKIGSPFKQVKLKVIQSTNEEITNILNLNLDKLLYLKESEPFLNQVMNAMPTTNLSQQQKEEVRNNLAEILFNTTGFISEQDMSLYDDALTIFDDNYGLEKSFNKIYPVDIGNGNMIYRIPYRARFGFLSSLLAGKKFETPEGPRDLGFLESFASNDHLTYFFVPYVEFSSSEYAEFPETNTCMQIGAPKVERVLTGGSKATAYLLRLPINVFNPDTGLVEPLLDPNDTSKGIIWGGPHHIGIDSNYYTGAYSNDQSIAEHLRNLPLTVEKTISSKVLDLRAASLISSAEFSLYSLLASGLYSNVEELKNLTKSSLPSSEKNKLLLKDTDFYFSDLALTRDLDERFRYLFYANYGEIAKNESIFGSLVTNPDLETRNELINSLEVVCLKVIRRRVGDDNSTVNDLGTKIVNNSQKRYEDDIVHVTKMINEDSTTGTLNQINLLDHSNTIFSRVYTGVDKSSSFLNDGLYQYGIELELIDNIPDLVRSKLSQLLILRSNLRELYDVGYMNYNFEANRFNMDFINQVMYSEKYPTLKGIYFSVPSKYIELLDFFTAGNLSKNLSDQNLQDLISTLSSMLNPSIGNLQTIDYFIKLMDQSITRISELLDFEPSETSAPATKISGISKEHSSHTFKFNSGRRRIKISHWFRETIQAGKHINSGYDYLSLGPYNLEAPDKVETYDSGLKLVTALEFKERTSREGSKYSFDTDNPGTGHSTTLTWHENFKRTQYKYLTPSVVYLKGTSPLIPLEIKVDEAAKDESIVTNYFSKFVDILRTNKNSRDVKVPLEQFGQQIAAYAKGEDYIPSITEKDSLQSKLERLLADRSCRVDFKGEGFYDTVKWMKNEQEDEPGIVAPENSPFFQGDTSNLFNKDKDGSYSNPGVWISSINEDAARNTNRLLSALTGRTRYNLKINDKDGFGETLDKVFSKITEPGVLTDFDKVANLPYQWSSAAVAKEGFAGNTIRIPEMLMSYSEEEKLGLSPEAEERAKHAGLDPIYGLIHFNYASTKRVEICLGLAGKTKLNFVPLTRELFNSISATASTALCRIVDTPEDNSAIDFEIPEQMELPIYNKYFLITSVMLKAMNQTMTAAKYNQTLLASSLKSKLSATVQKMQSQGTNIDQIETQLNIMNSDKGISMDPNHPGLSGLGGGPTNQNQASPSGQDQNQASPSGQNQATGTGTGGSGGMGGGIGSGGTPSPGY